MAKINIDATIPATGSRSFEKMDILEEVMAKVMPLLAQHPRS